MISNDQLDVLDVSLEGATPCLLILCWRGCGVEKVSNGDYEVDSSCGQGVPVRLGVQVEVPVSSRGKGESSRGHDQRVLTAGSVSIPIGGCQPDGERAVVRVGVGD